ncbi:alkaline phosphatase family protein [Desulfobaculum sp.]
MSHTVILVLVDGLSAKVAHACMGYLQAIVNAGHAQSYTLTCELPSLSRPLYECILTGVPPIVSGIVDNGVVRRSRHDSIFSLATGAGRTTAAAAYHWVSELYNRAPYDPTRDRYTDDPALPIQHGIFYNVDHYPDCHLFADAQHLLARHAPDLLFLHPMNVDDAGHTHGGDGDGYRAAARRMDSLLSRYVPQWQDAGHQVIITSDHGMAPDRMHGGTTDDERRVPLYVTGSRFSMNPSASPAQTQLCGLVCELLGITGHGKPHCKELLAS